MRQFLFALTLFLCWGDIKHFATNLFVVHLLNSFGGAIRSILAVSAVRQAVANKGIIANLVFAKEERRNIAKSFEMFHNVGLGPLVGHVLHKDVVVDLTHFLFGTNLELDTDGFRVALGLGERARSALRVAEADKAVAARGVVFVEGNLARDDVSELFEVVIEVLREHA